MMLRTIFKRNMVNHELVIVKVGRVNGYLLYYFVFFYVCLIFSIIVYFF